MTTTLPAVGPSGILRGHLKLECTLDLLNRGLQVNTEDGHWNTGRWTLGAKHSTLDTGSLDAGHWTLGHWINSFMDAGPDIDTFNAFTLCNYTFKYTSTYTSNSTSQSTFIPTAPVSLKLVRTLVKSLRNFTLYFIPHTENTPPFLTTSHTITVLQPRFRVHSPFPFFDHSGP